MAMAITDVQVGFGGRAAIMFKDEATGEGGMVTVVLSAGQDDSLGDLDRQARSSAKKILLEVVATL
jgi:hypothetical protein